MMFSYEYWGNNTFSAKDNMALEEYFLQYAQKNAVIRFFDFPKDSVILGYAQHVSAVKNPLGAPIVRRPTGGSHVQVGQNTLIYSFAVPRSGEFKNFEDMRKYYAQHVASALEDVGMENVEVDNKASTINSNGRVVASHAIIWGAKSALLHGLLIIDSYDAEKMMQRIFLRERKIGGEIYSEYSALKNMPTVSMGTDKAKNLRQQEARTQALKKIVAEAVLNRVTKNPKNMIINSNIIKHAHEIQQNKYGIPEWTEERRPPFTPEQIDAIPGEELAGKLKKGLGYCMYLQVQDKDFKNMAIPSV